MVTVRRVLFSFQICIPNPTGNLLFVQAILILSIYFPGSLCQETIYYRHSCSNYPFQCGSIRYLTYPFWGGSRPESCGRPGFELICQDDVPMLNISSLFYRVQEIDISTSTLKVAREDLWNNTCPKILRNITLDPDLFEFHPNSTDKNVTLFFDCAYNKPQQQDMLPHQFTCDIDGVKTINIFKTGNPSSGPGPDITCYNNIVVPVNHGAAQALKATTSSSINVLQDALARGFFIQWFDLIYMARSCNSQNSCSRESARAPPSPAPNPAPDEPQGLPLVQSPGPAAKNKGNGTQRENGPSPVQSPVSSPGTERDNSPTKNEKYRGPSLMGTVGGVVLAITVTTILTITIICCLKRRRSQGGPTQACNRDVEKFLSQHGSLARKRYKYSEIKKITKSFIDKLGQGGYGSVYKGMLPDGSLVAVKVLVETESNGEEFINEVASISRTSHVNIVNLLGFCYDGNKRALVYEFMPNKSLDKFISNTADCQLDLEKLYKIAVGVAKGLEYLHTGCNTRIVHFDIKPQNILLDEDFCPKISDFGLAKLCKKKQSILSMPGARGTIGYIAPEIFSRNFGGVSHKSDVYSFGMMVLEVVGARKIDIETETIQLSENYFPDKIYKEVILDVTERLNDAMIEEEEETRRKMFLVGFWCIQTIPSDRPSMSKVVEMLEGSLQSIQIPPKPFLFTPNVSGPEISPSLSEYVETENSAED